MYLPLGETTTFGQNSVGSSPAGAMEYRRRGGVRDGSSGRRLKKSTTAVIAKAATRAIRAQRCRRMVRCGPAFGGELSARLVCESAPVPSTGARNLYPLPGSVSTKRGLEAESPSASRILLIAVFRLCSKSTWVSGQTFSWSSSRVTARPGFSSSSAKARNGCSCNRTRSPLLRNCPASRSTSKTPKRTTLGRSDSTTPSTPRFYRRKIAGENNRCHQQSDESLASRLMRLDFGPLAAHASEALTLDR